MVILVKGISVKSPAQFKSCVKRDESIDFVRGLLMLGVMYGHVVDALFGGLQHVSIWVHSFVRIYDLPFFMIISGFLLRKSCERHGSIFVVINRIGMLGVPIVFWTLIRGHINIFGWMYYFLWAILLSGSICCFVRLISCKLKSEIKVVVEITCLLGFVVLFNYINFPWNMFYLFPYFAIGYYLKNCKFDCPKLLLSAIVMIFVAGLCFWSSAYTPWRLGVNAWTNGISWLSLYRFLLGLLGIVVMNKLFVALKNSLAGSPIFPYIVKGGEESMGLYVLHAILVSALLKKLCKVFWDSCGRISNVNFEYFIAYVIAPIITCLFFITILRSIKLIKQASWLRWTLGIKFVRG